ncbi:hypothetical protein M0812_18043 [Anaeramoeba flamelloides]|uniref:Cupin type-2 domain-containing protein n=1 Tax=Anaeramoeba flamelloides TaxID=1746091 RepID=A0AAV7Z7E8_9EUKA|nr:hypothetical protein M0812_18042 [Anaeramoeba flamelloides]KAJ3436000.1 hypothetical protein M0812_18043 [Anaeramoeba flamelloides]
MSIVKPLFIKSNHSGGEHSCFSQNTSSIGTSNVLLLEHSVGQVVDKHAHDEWHMIFVRSGKIQFTVLEAEYNAEPGDSLVIPPNTKHSFKVLGEKPCNTLCLTINK